MNSNVIATAVSVRCGVKETLGPCWKDPTGGTVKIGAALTKPRAIFADITKDVSACLPRAPANKKSNSQTKGMVQIRTNGHVLEWLRRENMAEHCECTRRVASQPPSISSRVYVHRHVWSA